MRPEKDVKIIAKTDVIWPSPGRPGKTSSQRHHDVFWLAGKLSGLMGIVVDSGRTVWAHTS